MSHIDEELDLYRQFVPVIFLLVSVSHVFLTSAVQSQNE